MSVQSAEQLMADMWSQLEQMRMKDAKEDAKKNPQKYYRSRIMDGNANYCYFNGGWLKLSNRLEHHQFCRTKHKNIGGCFLIFQNVTTYTPGGKWRKTERKNITPVDTLREARELTLKRRDRWRNEHPGHDEYKPVRARRKRRT